MDRQTNDQMVWGYIQYLRATVGNFDQEVAENWMKRHIQATQK